MGRKHSFSQHIGRFKQGYEVCPETDCWVWKKSRNTAGYGNFKAKLPGVGRIYKAHRFSYKIHYNDYDEKLFICHKCDNPPCVNPAHLFQGTAADNNADKIEKGRAGPMFRPSGRNPRAKLTREKAEIIRDMYKSNNFSQGDLAKKFNVCKNTIWCVLENKTWK